MKGPKDKDSEPYKWEDCRHTQEKPEIEKMGKLKKN